MAIEGYMTGSRLN